MLNYRNKQDQGMADFVRVISLIKYTYYKYSDIIFTCWVDRGGLSDVAQVTGSNTIFKGRDSISLLENLG